MKRFLAVIGAGMMACGLVVACFSTRVDAAAPPSVEFREGDRVVLLGGTFIERLQVYGQFETRLISALGARKLTVRNLGWSGDTVWGEARAVFGGPQDGFNRLLKDTREAKPTLILLQYGGNEAQAGPAGLKDFAAQLGRLLDALAETKARLVLLSPVRREKPSGPLPDPSPYNRDLNVYCETLAEVARQRRLAYVDLQDLFDDAPHVSEQGQESRPLRFTDNGLHPNEIGSAIASERLAAKLGAAASTWSVAIGSDGFKASPGLEMRGLERAADSVRFQATPPQLPAPSVYHNRQPAGLGAASQSARRFRQPDQYANLRVAGLAPGRYELLVDAKQLVVGDADQWAAGLNFEVPEDLKQADDLRQAIYDKNVLCFHRYRPQNETYLFLFRKHEQGNNAAEIPQFDPLIAEKEAEIAKLRIPATRTYELRRAR